jgi:hypothetical protein
LHIPDLHTGLGYPHRPFDTFVAAALLLVVRIRHLDLCVVELVQTGALLSAVVEMLSEHILVSLLLLNLSSN